MARDDVLTCWLLASFAKELKYDLQQFHYGLFSGVSSSLPFILHERKIREALRYRTYHLCDGSAD